ncbi:MAG: hypothetical protein H7Z77_09865 [Chitinophagaceae bacterium]|nr:hypothetical protein [Polaromonas sp.]
MAETVSNPKSRRVFDTSFRQQVVQMIKAQGLDIAQVYKDMKPGKSAVRR